jgi:hypothetical protein
MVRVGKFLVDATCHTTNFYAVIYHQMACCDIINVGGCDISRNQIIGCDMSSNMEFSWNAT